MLPLDTAPMAFRQKLPRTNENHYYEKNGGYIAVEPPLTSPIRPNMHNERRTRLPVPMPPVEGGLPPTLRGQQAQTQYNNDMVGYK